MTDEVKDGFLEQIDQLRRNLQRDIAENAEAVDQMLDRQRVLVAVLEAVECAAGEYARYMAKNKPLKPSEQQITKPKQNIAVDEMEKLPESSDDEMLPWPPADPKVIQDMRRDGMSDVVIAKRHGKTPQTVLNYRNKHKILVALGRRVTVEEGSPSPAKPTAPPAARQPEHVHADAPAPKVLAVHVPLPKPIAAPMPSIKSSPEILLPKLQPTQRASHIRRVEPGRQSGGWSEEEDERILAMDADGALPIDIARTIDRTPGEVYVRREDLKRSGRARRSTLKQTGRLLDYRSEDEEPGDYAGHYEAVSAAEAMPRKGGD